MKSQLELILHNIRSNHNVGSIFRTADGAGVAKLWLTGYTPAPLDQFKRVNNEIAKTALGAEQSLAWEKRESIVDLITDLKNQGYKVLALEQNEKSINYTEVKLTGKTALIVGNEVGGVEPEILNLCDQIIEIPMRGTKESLNVAVATGIIAYKLLEN
ncbi:MAG: RNA methyltransferase [Candidatus Pacebacteria bacterium]|nr:RNA methyltransferase [Candidatus Paceibacterota bacterium]